MHRRRAEELQKSDLEQLRQKQRQEMNEVRLGNLQLVFRPLPGMFYGDLMGFNEILPVFCLVINVLMIPYHSVNGVTY